MLQTILASYPDISFLALVESPYLRQRIHFDSSWSFDKRIQEGISLLQNELGEDMQAFFYLHVLSGTKLLTKKIHGFQERGIDRIIKDCPKESYRIPYEKNMYIVGFGLKSLSSEHLSILVRAVIEMDTGVPPSVTKFSVMFLSKNASKLIKIYDDRGLDMIQAGVYVSESQESQTTLMSEYRYW